MSFFTEIETAPPDPMFNLAAKCRSDPSEFKVDLGIGAYRDNDGKPWVLPSVQLAEEKLTHDKSYNHEYLPINGLQGLVESSAARIIFGEKTMPEHRVTVQSLSGTGALHLAAAFLSKFSPKPKPKVYVSDPTWGNHYQIFENVGFEVDKYPYWNPVTLSLDFDGFLGKMESIDEGSIIVLHTCAHNPTGVDLTRSQWRELHHVIYTRHLCPIFDTAYQGFATGSLDEDAWPIRYFTNHPTKKMELIVCQSFAKNFGLYGERAGGLHFVLDSEKTCKALRSQLAILTRSEISNPPSYGAKIVATILNDPVLYKQWVGDLQTMSQRIILNRKSLKENLIKLGTPGNWDHITNQIGMFSFTGLNTDQVKRLVEEFHIYMASSGRISMAGLNTHNIEYTAKCIDIVARDQVKKNPVTFSMNSLEQSNVVYPRVSFLRLM